MSKSIAETFSLIEALRERGEDFCLVTIVRTADATSAKAGAKAVVTGDGTLHGYIGGACVTSAVRRVALEVLHDGAPKLIRVKPSETVLEAVDIDGVDLYKSSCPSGGTAEVFLEPMRHRPRLVVCGVSPVALTLEKLGMAMGYETIVAAHIDPAGAQDVEGRLYPNFDFADLALNDRDAVVVATQGVRDREALKSALTSSAGYVGMVGSSKKIATLLERIGSEVSARQKARFHGPAGLRIGAIAPEEIALSILAQIVDMKCASARASQEHASGEDEVSVKSIGSQNG